MKSPCCSDVGAVLIYTDGAYLCSVCATNRTIHALNQHGYDFTTDLMGFLDDETNQESICDCGASKTSNSNLHSNWCSVSNLRS